MQRVHQGQGFNGSPAWEADALTRRLNGCSASLEFRGVRFTCTAPTRWPPYIYIYIYIYIRSKVGIHYYFARSNLWSSGLHLFDKIFNIL